MKKIVALVETRHAFSQQDFAIYKYHVVVEAFHTCLYDEAIENFMDLIQ